MKRPGREIDRGTVPGRWHVVAGAGLLLGVIAGMALLVEHDAAGQAPAAETSIGDLLKRHGTWWGSYSSTSRSRAFRSSFRATPSFFMSATGCHTTCLP